MNFDFLIILKSINVKDKMPLNGIFKSYDKNSNSIWDEDEIKNLIDDAEKFADEDGNMLDFSEAEIDKYSKYLASKTNNKNDKNIIKTFFQNLKLYQKVGLTSFDNLLKLMSFQSEDMLTVLNEVEDFNIVSDSDNTVKIVTYKNGKDYEYTFNQEGLIEYKITEDDQFDEEPFSREFINEHIEGNDNNIEENIKYRRFNKNDPTNYTVEEMEINRNGIITTISKQENGLYDIEENRPNGDSQKTTFDEETGTLTVDKHFVSPEGVVSEFHSETSDTKRILTYRITDAEGNVLLDKRTTLTKTGNEPETYLYEVTESGNTQTFELSITDNSIKIKNSENKEHIINLTDFVKKEENIDFFMNILKRVPPDQLFLLTEENLNELIHRQDNMYDGCCLDTADGKFNIEIDKYDDEQSYFNVFMHEYGHFIDGVSGKSIENNSELKEIFKIEYDNFIKNTTSSDRKILEHITNEQAWEDDVDLSECVAEANAALNSGVTISPNQLRIYYYQKFFPRTICKISELLSETVKNS